VGDLIKTGYNFAGWNTVADGTGIHYNAGTQLIINNANVTLYAQWTVLPTYTVTYNGNGNTGGAAPIDNTAYLNSASVTTQLVGDLIKTGYNFAGWNTVADGTGIHYNAGTQLIINNADVMLYAQWTALPTYPISITVNPAGSGSVTCTPNPAIHNGNSTCTATANTGYTFSAFDGDCIGATCQLNSVTSNKNVVANFTSGYSL
ncbi:InlB B-repeat-containing protein, partial [Thiospirillum jenense]